jgi:hypothetical protein
VVDDVAAAAASDDAAAAAAVHDVSANGSDVESARPAVTMAEDAAALEIAAVDTMAGDAAALEIAAIAAMASEAPSAPVDRRTSEMTIAPDRVVRGTSLDAEADDMGRNVSHANTALPLVATAAVDHEAIAAPEAAALNPRSRSASTPKRIAGLDAAKPAAGKSAPARCARCDDRARRQAPLRTRLLRARARRSARR